MTNCGYELGTVERDDPHTERRRDSVRGRASLGTGGASGGRASGG
eukprot:COSAG04_NODE_28906_length_272_cov_0.895954_1_plen_44_part_01